MIHNRPELKNRRKDLRNNPTPAETLLWNVLQRSNLGGISFGGNTAWDAISLIFTVLRKSWPLSWMATRILSGRRQSMTEQEPRI